jgi:acyl-CoA dehydrogenase
MGFIEETGAAQHLRDARIAPIYEGTNGIQAMDLVMRKLPTEGGGAMRALLEETRATATRASAVEGALQVIGTALQSAVAALERSAALLTDAVANEPNRAAGAATPFLKQMGLTLGAAFLTEEAMAAADRLAGGGGENADFLHAKIATAQFYAEQILPQAAGHAAAVAAPAESLYAIPAELLGS